MATPIRPDLERAIRLVAGDLPQTTDIEFDDPQAHAPGRLDKRVLLQATWWIDIRAHRRRLETMSADYRANVLAHLEQQGPGWVQEAMVWVFFDCLRRSISPAEAADRLDLLDLLTGGWTDHTPLGRRLHQLNGTTPHELEPPPPLLGPAETDLPEILRSNDHGTWRITTESTTTYLIDLDERRIARHPGTGAGNGSGPVPPGVRVKQLPFDTEWTDISGLVQCRLDRSLFILDERPSGPGYRISTPVTRIEPVAMPQETAPREPGTA